MGKWPRVVRARRPLEYLDYDPLGFADAGYGGSNEVRRHIVNVTASHVKETAQRLSAFSPAEEAAIRVINGRLTSRPDWPTPTAGRRVDFKPPCYTATPMV